jgi:hypothetical protein
MKLFASLLFSFLLAGAMAVYSTKDIVKDYGKIFAVKVVTKGDQKVVQQTMYKLSDSHYLAGMVNENPRMLLYLVENYTSLDQEKMNEMSDDTEELEKYYLSTLQNDPVFNEQFMQMAANYLQAKNSSISDVTVRKDTLPMDSLLNVASRFFLAEEVRPDGNINWKIVSGIENMPQYQDIHRPIMEAFSYATILTHYNTSGIKNDFMTGAGQVQGEQGVVVGQIDDEKLLAVRKGVFDYMAQSEALKQVLRDEYEKRKDVLDFTLAD